MLNQIKKLNINFYPQKLFFQPAWIILGVNNICNLHCKMCDVGTKYSDSLFYHHMAGARPINMPVELIHKVIDQTANFFPKAKLGYAFTEPGIYPYLIESLHYANTKNLFTSMTTNALQLPAQAADLCDAHLNELNISLDGPAEIHNYIRGNKHSFEKALEGIEKIFSVKGIKPSVSVFCAITEWNIGSLVKFAGTFKRYPLKHLGFLHSVFTQEKIADLHNDIFKNSYPATASNMKEINLENYDLKKLFQEITELRKKIYPFSIHFSPVLKTFEQLEIYYKQPEKQFGKFCFDAFSNLMIKSDGTVIPSHSRCYNVIGGNLYQNDLKEIWNSSNIGNFRKTLIDEGGLLPACSRCCSAT